MSNVIDHHGHTVAGPDDDDLPVPETRTCSYCRVDYPSPVEYHHTVEECADNQERRAYDARVRELSALGRPALAAIWRRLTEATLVYVNAPPERWSKDELIVAVLREEFPRVIRS